MYRRQFIASGLGALAWAGVGATAAAAAAVVPAARGTAPGAQGFASLLNQQFKLYDNVRGVAVTLVKITHAPPQPGMQQFTLSFEGERSGALPSGTYEVEHPLTGVTAMYLDASAHGQHAVRYRADFNLMHA